MADQKDVKTRESTEARGREDESDSALRPPVDIFEDAEGIMLIADMPGVSKDRLNIEVDKDRLIVEGTVQLDIPEGMEALHADVRSTRYLRSFALSSELATDEIDASLKNGVLNLRIPKRHEIRPRKIEVRVG